MSKKLQETPQVQHVHEQTVSDILVPMTDCDYTTGTSPQSNLADKQKEFVDSYESKRAQEFEKSRAIAQERLDRLQSTGFNPTEPFDEASTADAVERKEGK